MHNRGRMTTEFTARVLTLAILFAGVSNGASSEWVHPGPDGRLVYKTTQLGDRVMDFSYAGYMGGGVALPEVPVKITVQPVEGDNTASIQEAVDKVAAMNPHAGFRGAVLLAPGDYTCSGTITIRSSGVVLRGSGSGDKGSTLRMVGGRHPAIAINSPAEARPGGEADRREGRVLGRTLVTDAYVPSGASTFTVADANALAPGDVISIQHPVTKAWVHFMQMDDLRRDGRPQTWLGTSRRGSTLRTIKAVAASRVTVDIPLSDCLDTKLLSPPGVAVLKMAPSARVDQVGVEHLHIQCPAMEVAYTEAPYSAIRIGGDDCWVRDVSCEETMNSTTIAGRRITLQQVVVKHTFANLGASKPTDFSIEGSQILIDRCSVSGGNMYFVWTGSLQSGPNVLLSCTFTGRGSRVQPHMRWSTGLLVDGCRVPEGNIDFMNRGAMGSGHGWTMGWAVAWNCQAKAYVIQNPPGAVNWAIGCIGKGAPTPRPFDSGPALAEGIFDSPGVPVAPTSLYLAQLAERLGTKAVANIGYSILDFGFWSSDLPPGDKATGSPDPAYDSLRSKIHNPQSKMADPIGPDLAEHRLADASNVRGGDRAFAGERALDGDPKTYWTTDDGVTQASLEVDLEGPEVINAAEIQEPVELGQRIQSYRVEAVIDGVWKVLSQGTDIGGRRLDRFGQVTTWKVRLTILAATASPAISRFGLYLDTASPQKDVGLAPTPAAARPTAESPKTEGHPFVATDYTQGKVFIVSTQGKVEWEYPAETCNDIWILASGNLLFNTGHGVREVNRDKQVVFNYTSASEIYACQRLANGNTFIAECNSGRLLDVDPSGKVVKEIRLLPEGQDGGHAYMRNARRLESGHTLVAHYGLQIVREYDPQGKCIREIPAPGGPHSVIRLPNGNTLISCADGQANAKVIEVDPDGKVVWQVQGDELPGISLKFMAGLQRLPNGNTVMANWLGHNQFGKAPHLIEVTPDRRVVWTFADHQAMKTISSVQLLDVPGDVTRGEILH